MDNPDVAGGENALGAFLRERRALAKPEQYGIVSQGRRQVRGLRREEVAMRAGLSTGYYTRLEQGRERNPSPEVLRAVAHALRFDEPSRAKLEMLARSLTRNVRPRGEKVSPHLLRLMDDLARHPAFVLGHAYDILARNRLAAMLLGCFAEADNLARMVFLDPAAHDFYRDWERAAQSVVAALRPPAARMPDDPRLTALVGELSMKSSAFRRLWGRHDLTCKTSEAKAFRHPEVGDLDLHYEAFAVNSSPGQQLVVYQAEPASPSADALALLGTLAASREERVRDEDRPRR
ncbi:helix-turn-helix domain-containing protein [Microbispora sp. ATCC PTA-5024]|uniref:helix-turn-helix domain-containing protein n=1 Tax=Microbispora sp. ATCC PTA-5024 TaxID=316330 RepID=UPI0003DBB8AB|nr:helix-turn-helix transcriptional regulator [Microbispora sp. ATCC PTA-5024]ETK33820.1 XRE family transcriptional regulator [Microbispora sp. ATCC PTA-5024]